MKRIFTKENIKIMWGMLSVIVAVIMYYTVCLSEQGIITEVHFWLSIIAETAAWLVCLYNAGAFIWQQTSKNNEEK
jgi:cobalamin biosynthesis protein CobD/CbiB